MSRRWIAVVATSALLLGAAARAQTGVAPPSPAAATVRPAAPEPTPGLVNLNEATPDELERLPGIGPAKARAIVQHRQAHRFRRVEELTRVKGIGRKTLQRLKAYLATSGPTTLKTEPRR